MVVYIVIIKYAGGRSSIVMVTLSRKQAYEERNLLWKMDLADKYASINVFSYQVEGAVDDNC